ncbi:YkgJ family cysteine cluster protein [Caldithrix abyssi]
MDSLIQALEAFYQKVDENVHKLEELNRARLHCKAGCADCCLDGITVFEAEAAYIRHKAESVLKEKPHRTGKCAFLDEADRCRIYAFRPYVCRTQGLPLRWFEYNESGFKVEYRDICPLNEKGPDLQTLDEKYFWEIGPAEQELAELQQKFKSGRLKRVPLRELFYK